MASIYGRPEYAIRLANKLPNGNDVWENATGYNNLGHSISINSSASNTACGSEIGFILASAYSNTCVQNLNIEGIAIPSGQYHSDGEMTVSNTSIADNASVLLQSDTGVTLNAGTEIGSGRTLDVVIGACRGN
jgi:hypothetical protein